MEISHAKSITPLNGDIIVDDLISSPKGLYIIDLVTDQGRVIKKKVVKI